RPPPSATRRTLRVVRLKCARSGAAEIARTFAGSPCASGSVCDLVAAHSSTGAPCQRSSPSRGALRGLVEPIGVPCRGSLVHRGALLTLKARQGSPAGVDCSAGEPCWG